MLGAAPIHHHPARHPVENIARTHPYSAILNAWCRGHRLREKSSIRRQQASRRRAGQIEPVLDSYGAAGSRETGGDPSQAHARAARSRQDIRLNEVRPSQSGQDRQAPRSRLRGMPQDGDTWVHLRLCTARWARRLLRTNRRQARHQALSTRRAPDHHLVEPGESWSWCYVDELAIGAGMRS